MKKIIEKLSLLNKDDKYILALSGGVDSVVMLDLLSNANVDFVIAHCNFNLRGEESDHDEIFVRELVKKYNAKAEFISFDTKGYAQNNKISIQMAARDLRYDWFEKLKINHNAKAIFTAHHLDDSIETFFINLGRGSGLKGLSGINEKRGNYYRPLLDIGREQIVDYAKLNKLEWREDSSNSSVKYQRNFLRHNVIPQIQTIFPQFANTMYDNMNRINEANSYIEHSIKSYIAKISITSEYLLKAMRADIVDFSHPKLLLFYLLKPYGFTDTQLGNILLSLKNNTNTTFNSRNYNLEISYSYLYLFVTKEYLEINHQLDLDENENTDFNIKWEILNVKDISEFQKNKIYFDYNKIPLPLSIRNPKQADKFKPFGVKGKKLISDYFKNIKIPSHKRKEKLLLVDSNDNIMWIIPEKTVDIYTVDDSTTDVLIFNSK